MPLGEASAVACRLAAEHSHGLVAAIDADRLQQRLIARGTRISFFNDALTMIAQCGSRPYSGLPCAGSFPPMTLAPRRC